MDNFNKQYNSANIILDAKVHEVVFEGRKLRYIVPTNNHFKEIIKSFNKEISFLKKQKNIFVTGTYGKTSFVWQASKVFNEIVDVASFSYSMNLSLDEIVRHKFTGISKEDSEFYLKQINDRDIDLTMLSRVEISFLLCLVYFYDRKPKYIFWENYIGGMFDFIQMTIGCPYIIVTNIGTDHSKQLSPSEDPEGIKEDIAIHKVGSLIRSQNAKIIASDDHYIRKVFDQYFHDKKSEIYYVEYKNELFIKKLMDIFNLTYPLKDIKKIISKVITPLRLEKFVRKNKKLFILDSAYTPTKVNSLYHELSDKFSLNKVRVLLSTSKNEELLFLLRELMHITTKISICSLHDTKQDGSSPNMFYNTKEINSFLHKFHLSKNVKVYDSIEKAIVSYPSNKEEDEILVVLGFPIFSKIVKEKLNSTS